MTQANKLIKKIFGDSQISYKDAEKILLGLGFHLKVKG